MITRILSAILKPIIHAVRPPTNHIPRFLSSGLTIGRDVSILPDVEIDYSHYWHVTIGDEVTLAPGVRIIAHDASTKKHLGYTRIGKIIIGNRVFVGACAIILPGVTIGENSIIGAGSVVTCSIPPNVVAAGNPAKVICKLETFLAKRSAELQRVPVFGPEYTLNGGITNEMRAVMNQTLGSGFGYVD